MEHPSNVPLLTSDVARILSVSEGTVRLWERLGRLPAVRTDRGMRLFDRKDVERLVAELAASHTTEAA